MLTLRRIALLLQSVLEDLELDTGESFILYKPMFILKLKTNAMIFSLTTTIRKVGIHPPCLLFGRTHVLHVSLMRVLLVVFIASWSHVYHQILVASQNEFKLFLFCFYFAFYNLGSCEIWNYVFFQWLVEHFDITILAWCFHIVIGIFRFSISS